jgi:hypothetical protein
LFQPSTQRTVPHSRQLILPNSSVRPLQLFEPGVEQQLGWWLARPGPVSRRWLTSCSPRPGDSASDLTERASYRDTAKLADFDGFAASMRLDAALAVSHLTVDNRLSTTSTLREQIAALVDAVR